jgi:modulator of FtsH protease
MNESLQTVYAGGGSSIALEQRNRVLRNTYWLLALSLVPTVLGAWVGVATGFTLFAGRPFVGFMVFMAAAFGFFWAINKTKDSGLGVVLLLAFTFFMGLMLSRLIGQVLGFRNGASLIMTAFGGTAAVFFTMATLSTTIKRDLSGWGKWLMVGVVMLLIASVANIWLQMPALALTISSLVIVVFSAFLLYDLKRIVDGGETNYVMATLNVYLDLYNIFVHLLSLLGILGGERE